MSIDKIKSVPSYAKHDDGGGEAPRTWEEAIAVVHDKMYGNVPNKYGSTHIECLDACFDIFPKGKPLVDVGAGQGRNTMPLLRHGLDVDIVDLSQVGVDIIKDAAERESLKLRDVFVGDVANFIPQKEYGGVVMSFIWQQMERNKALSLIRKMQDATVPGGIHALGVFTKNGDLYDSAIKKYGDRFFINTDELIGLYGDEWELIYKNEVTVDTKSKKPDGSYRDNDVVYIAFRKKLK